MVRLVVLRVFGELQWLLKDLTFGNMKFLDIDNWPRKWHFEFFSKFEEPFWGVTVEVDCTKAYEKAKAIDSSFFIYYLHKSVKAANLIEEFKYRIDEESRIVIHDSINASATINRPDGTFGFSYIKYHDDYSTFEKAAQEEINRVKNSHELTPSNYSDNIIHYSSLPWIKFTAISHARSYSINDSVPKISFGKLVSEGTQKTMPVSIHVHHGLMDGFHVGKYCELFQDLLNG